MKSLCQLLLLQLLLACGTLTSHASVIFTDSFNGYTTSSGPGSQVNTGLSVYHSGTITGWSNSGIHTAHAVDLGSGDYALQLFNGFSSNANILTQSTGIAANDFGTEYLVSFDAAPTVWSNPSEATAAGDAVLIELLRTDNSVLTSFTQAPGIWSGTASAQNSFNSYSFSYTGDGSGSVRLRLSGSPADDSRFGGAIDNLAISSTPEPDRAMLLLTGVLVLALTRRRAT